MKNNNLNPKENFSHSQAAYDFLKTTIATLFILIISISTYSQTYKYTTDKTIRVVYILQQVADGTQTDYNGTKFDNIEYKLVGIITKEYFFKNKSKVISKYPNSKIYSGIVYGNPLVTKGIYVEPYINDKMQIDNILLSKYYGSVRLPMSCERKGTKCSIDTDTALTVYMYVTSDRWSSTKGYSSESIYKILKLKGTGSIGNNNYVSNPKQVKFKQSPLITRIYTSKYPKF